MKATLFGLALASIVALQPPPDPPPPVLPGLDVLREMNGMPLRGRRLGLITNHTGKTVDGIPSVRLLRDELGLELRALFSPEHGFDGEVAAGDTIASGREPQSRLPLHSLYGETRKPTPDMLRGLDTLVFDIQDIGVRFYTYISTLKVAMDAAAAAGLEVFVLDRPNPNGGVRVEGPILDPRFESFVGIAPLPVLHGMTVGEIARWLNEEGFLEGRRRVKLGILPARGWRRDMAWEDTGLPWRATSPNIRTLESAIAYPALGLFEGINVSEGRGTEETFLIAGAPWIRIQELVSALEARKLPGVRFTPERFVPEKIPAAPRPIYPGQECLGFRLQVGEPARFRAVLTGLTAIAQIRALHREDFEWEKANGAFTIDRLLGTDVVRLRLDAGESPEAILRPLDEAVKHFSERRQLYLMYP